MNSGESKMSKTKPVETQAMKVSIANGTASQFFERVRSHAQKLDRGESIAPAITITFEDPLELLNVLTAERVRLLRRARKGSQPIADLASGLKRDVRAVSRDVVRLEKAGLLRTSYRVNPGHGRHKVVEPVAREYTLTANL
jgi:predicted transcriptional regulator